MAITRVSIVSFLYAYALLLVVFDISIITVVTAQTYGKQQTYDLHVKTNKDPAYDNKLRQVKGEERWDALLKPPFESSHASFIENFHSSSYASPSESSSNPVKKDSPISKILAWFSGSGEGQSGVAIVISYFKSFGPHLTKDTLLNSSTDNGRQEGDDQVVGEWTNAVVVSQFEGYSNQNPVLYQEMMMEHTKNQHDHHHHEGHGKQNMHLFHTRQIANEGEDNATVWYLHLDDTKMEWSKPVELFKEPQGSFIRNRMVKTELDELILPFYYEADYEHSNIKLLPKNKEMTDSSNWKDIEFPISEMGDGTTYMIQPSVVPLNGKGEYVAYFRDTKQRNIYQSFSNDYGHSWTKPTANVLPNNNSGLQALRLKSGRLAMVYNPIHTGRDPLTISLSEDNGKTWKYTRVLEQEDGEQEFSYPSLVQENNYEQDTVVDENPEDILIHISYTWKRETIKHSIVTENWIMDKSHQYHP